MEYKKILEMMDFSKGLIPAIVQDDENGEVLMLAYMNEEALKRTVDTKKTWFWSRSRKSYWNKGETSGHFQYVKSIGIDCDGDTILIKVKQVGAACHTGNRSCFYRSFEFEDGGAK
ncbi:phosphoribosyl-AMP cyclohydrolase [Clostridium acetobutylicum]|nr:phosphoribosyl-AMP cyclohydrolase [Clostridium acetobutylicum]